MANCPPGGTLVEPEGVRVICQRLGCDLDSLNYFSCYFSCSNSRVQAIDPRPAARGLLNAVASTVRSLDYGTECLIDFLVQGFDPRPHGRSYADSICGTRRRSWLRTSVTD